MKGSQQLKGPTHSKKPTALKTCYLPSRTGALRSLPLMPPSLLPPPQETLNQLSLQSPSHGKSQSLYPHSFVLPGDARTSLPHAGPMADFALLVNSLALATGGAANAPGATGVSHAHGAQAFADRPFGEP